MSKGQSNIEQSGYRDTDKDIKLVIGLAANAPQSGKTTFYNTAEKYIQEKFPSLSVLKLSFAGPLKEALSVLLAEASGRSKEETLLLLDDANFKSAPAEPVSVFGGHTVRHLLQLMGTEFGRDMINNDIWVEMLCSNVINGFKKHDIIIIDDMRMYNEYQTLEYRFNNMIIEDKYKSQFKPIYIYRPTKQVTSHASEGALNFLYSENKAITIDNTNTLDIYKFNVKNTVEDIVFNVFDIRINEEYPFLTNEM